MVARFASVLITSSITVAEVGDKAAVRSGVRARLAAKRAIRGGG
jgi:hypothetical protein